MIYDEQSIRLHYKNASTARKYISKRFMKPLGRVQHGVQASTINELIRKFNIKKILEIACGPARLTSDVAGFKKGIAIDASDKMLEIARCRVNKKRNWQFVQADAFNPGLKETFELIYSFRFVRHFKFHDRIKLYKVFNKHLEASGTVVFDAVHYDKIPLVRNLENRGQRLIYDKIYYDPNQLKNEVKLAGFEIVELKGIVNHFYLQAAISRISNKLRLDQAGIRLIQLLERIALGQPLEWIVICRKQ